VIKIFKSDGLDVATVKIPFVVGRSQVTDIRGRTIRADGSIEKLDPNSAREQTVAKARRYRQKDITFDMPGAEVGAVLEYQYTFIINYRLANFSFTIQAGVPVLEAVLHVVPGETNYTPKLLAAKGLRLTQEVGKKGRMTLTVRNVPSFKEEPYMPPEGEVRGVLYLYPANPWWNFGSIAYGYDEFIKKYYKRSSKTRKLTKQVIGEADTPAAQIERIYRWIQDNIDNTTYRETAEGEEEQEERNLYVDDVIAAGKGTYSDLTRLFVYMARQAGLDAHVALVSTRDEAFFKEDTFIPWDLNQELAVIKRGDRWKFYDPGTRYCPIGMVDWESEGVGNNAVIARGTGGMLTRVMPSRARDNLTKRVTRMTLDAEGGVTAEVTVTRGGLAGVAARNRIDHQTAEERRSDLEESLGSGFAGVELEELEIVNLDEWDEPLQVRYSFRAEQFGTSAGSRLLIPALPYHHGNTNPFSAQERTNPIYYTHTYKNIDELTIELPEGYTVESLPTPRKSDIQALFYRTTFHQEPGEVMVNREMMVDILLIEPAQYKMVRRLYQVAAQTDASEIVLKASAAPAADEPAADDAEEGR